MLMVSSVPQIKLPVSHALDMGIPQAVMNIPPVDYEDK